MFDHSKRLYHISVEDAIKQIRGGSRISSWRGGGRRGAIPCEKIQTLMLCIKTAVDVLLLTV
jgi:hypothetical protein